MKMNEVILETIKSMIGIPDDDSFDLDLLIAINASFAELDDMGVVTYTEEIDDSTEWGYVVNDTVSVLSLIKQYIYLSVKLAFDPPTNGIINETLKSTKDRLSWRLHTKNNYTEVSS